jgi:hypothetical protein
MKEKKLEIFHHREVKITKSLDENDTSLIGIIRILELLKILEFWNN